MCPGIEKSGRGQEKHGGGNDAGISQKKRTGFERGTIKRGIIFLLKISKLKYRDALLITVCLS